MTIAVVVGLDINGTTNEFRIIKYSRIGVGGNAAGIGKTSRLGVSKACNLEPVCSRRRGRAIRSISRDRKRSQDRSRATGTTRNINRDRKLSQDRSSERDVTRSTTHERKGNRGRSRKTGSIRSTTHEPTHERKVNQDRSRKTGPIRNIREGRKRNRDRSYKGRLLHHHPAQRRQLQPRLKKAGRGEEGRTESREKDPTAGR